MGCNVMRRTGTKRSECLKEMCKVNAMAKQTGIVRNTHTPEL